MKNQYLIIIFLFLTGHSFSQLTVLDPQQQWNTSPGSIKNLEIDIQTFGMYYEVAYTFDVFTKNSDWFYNDQLEYVLNFKLEEEAVVNDSWLWIEDYISKGVIYEKNYGTEIYEGIVDRQQDPSILTKHTDQDYELRIYPMHPDSTRKVMFSFISPMNGFGLESQISVPINVFNQSELKVQNVTVNISPDQDWSLLNFTSDNIEFDTHSGNSTEYLIKDLSKESRLSIPLSKNDNSSYFQVYSDGDENFYQLAVFPEFELPNEPNYYLIVVDYEDQNSAESKNQILLNLQDALSSALKENDFFNIVYSDFVIEFLYDDWQVATTENITSAFTRLNAINIDENSSFRQSVAIALNYLSTYDFKTNCLIYSNDNVQGVPGNAFDLIEDIEEVLDGSEISLHAYDYANRNIYSYWHNGSNYYGNGLLYYLMNLNFDGVYNTLFQGEYLDETLSQIALQTNSQTDIFDLQISIDDGFSYSEYDNLQDQYNYGQPIISLGKIYGEGDVQFSFSGLLNGEIFQLEDDISFGSISNNAITKSLWASRYILEVEDSSTSEAIQTTIELSKDASLLSKRTVFLCLEPSLVPLGDDFDIETTVDTDDLVLELQELTIAPNPFIHEIEIQFSSEGIKSKEDIVLELVNAAGQVIDANFEIHIQSNDVVIKLVNGDELLEGMYFVKIMIPNGSKVIKIIKQ